MTRISRRNLLKAGLLAAGASGGTLGAARIPGAGAARRSGRAAAAGRVVSKVPVARRGPGSLPFPDLPAGTDTMPEIEHIVVLMMENHSYDNYLGMLGRRPGHRPRGDGFTIGPNGKPTNSNPDGKGGQLTAFRMPNDCQAQGKPSQEWVASHQQYDKGRNDGFVTSPSGPVAMGYWDGSKLPFYYSLASTFPLADRWFSPMLGQTIPQRRFLTAATSNGMVDDTGGLLADKPPNGTIFTMLERFGLTWRDYYHSGSNPTTWMWLTDPSWNSKNNVSIDNFFTHAKKGSLPNFCIVDPDFGSGSEEDPQDISVGEAFSARVVNAVMQSPAWHKTLLVWTYDEHGGYYDHVPPPAALAPDDSTPQPSTLPPYQGFHRYGFRVPAVVVSPWAKRDYVSHCVYDHTSILAMVERKWNLPALTLRDANANDLTGFLDLRTPHFLRPPTLARPAPAPSGCTPGDPGTIPS